MSYITYKNGHKLKSTNLVLIETRWVYYICVRLPTHVINLHASQTDCVYVTTYNEYNHCTHIIILTTMCCVKSFARTRKCFLGIWCTTHNIMIYVYMHRIFCLLAVHLNIQRAPPLCETYDRVGSWGIRVFPLSTSPPCLYKVARSMWSREHITYISTISGCRSVASGLIIETVVHLTIIIIIIRRRRRT